MNNTNNNSAERSYEKAKRIFAKAWLPNFNGDMTRAVQYAESLKLSQSELRLEVSLNATSNAFTFGVTENQPNSSNVQYNTEKRLALQDSLVVNEYGIFVGAPASSTANYELKSYGNLITFSATDYPILNNGLNSAYLQLICNNDVIVPYRGLFNNFYRPQTQQTAAVAASSPGDQIRGAEDGFVTVEPNILLIGSKNYKPQVIFPAALTGLTQSTYRLVLIFRGILAQNSTSVS